jgi:hypothetical protein
MTCRSVMVSPRNDRTPPGSIDPAPHEGTSIVIMSSTIKKKLALGVVATTAVGATIALGLSGGSAANADPKQFDALVGFGSDTTQDVMNALSGFNLVNFDPVQTTEATGKTQLVSWDAFIPGIPVPTNCISTKPGAPPILRPNGSTNGRRILSRAFTGAPWGNVNCGLRDVSGMVDFARSSAPPAPGDTGTALTYLPFGRDALTFAYAHDEPGPFATVTQLDTAQLTSLHIAGPAIIDGTPVFACGIQLGSGTYQSWVTSIEVGVNDDVGTEICNNLGGTVNADGRLQESNGPDMRTKSELIKTISHPICDGEAGGDPVPCTNAQVIGGYSASQYIARSNGVAEPATGPGVFLGGIDALPVPVVGDAPDLTPNGAFYESPQYGRDVYNVVASVQINEASGSFDRRVKEMFVGPDSAVCQAPSTIATFGFLPLGPACGNTDVTGGFIS